MSNQQYVGPNATYAGVASGGLTALPQIIPSYLYVQYADDDNLQALVMAYNQVATEFLTWFNTLNLPIYTGGVVSGPLLDWVAQGLYGIMRPSITTGAILTRGATNVFPTNVEATDQRQRINNEVLQSVNDDIFRRVITWNFYKGDGFVFSTEWLKRRIVRFLNGPNGISPVIDNTYQVSASVSGTTFTIVCKTTTPNNGTLLNALINSGACATPFPYTFSLTATTGLTNVSGTLHLSPNTGYPTSAIGGVGALWSNGGVVTCIGYPTTPNPAAPPVYFGMTDAVSLYELSGANLPITAPPTGSLQIWNNTGVLHVA